MLAYLNGKFVPYDQATISVGDYGFTMGVTVTEQLRTFKGTPHLLERHLDRLNQGLQLIGLQQPADLSKIAIELTAKNYAELDPDSDLSLGICITPGSSGAPGEPTVLVYNLELPFQKWAQQYDEGLQLTTVQTRELSGDSVPKQLKCRSRMHYYLAELEASSRTPGARALLLDQAGNIAEATTASIAIIQGDQLIAPPEADVLPSIAFEFTATLAAKSGIDVIRRSITPDDLRGAEEVLWLSTPMCILPVTGVDNLEIGRGKPGPLFSKLIAAWSDAVGIDIIKQAQLR